MASSNGMTNGSASKKRRTEETFWGFQGRQSTMVASCSLNQLAMDFDGNLDRTLRSMFQAKKAGARYRLGPELELSGYSCEDHFLETDTVAHSCESLAGILKSSVTEGMLCDVGLPFLHQGVLYNCRALLLNGKILLIRPKCILADDLNYRESRWFTPWEREKLVTTPLPKELQQATGLTEVPFGDAVLDLDDITVGIEVCEELWSPSPVSVRQYLAGARLIGNGNASHHEVGKQRKRLQMLLDATRMGGAYVYANQLGCDGARLYFDGGSMIVDGGELLAMGQQYAMREIEVVTAVLDLHKASSTRAGHAASVRIQAHEAKEEYPRIRVEFSLGGACSSLPSAPIQWKEPCREEQIARSASIWLWDQLRRTVHRCGFFLATSGGADSSTVATLVSAMCREIVATAQGSQGKEAAEHIKSELSRVIVEERCGKVDVSDHRAVCNRLFHTAFMRTKLNGDDTHRRAVALSGATGAHFHVIEMDGAVAAMEKTFQETVGKLPSYGLAGGTHHENNMLSQIRGRLRMVTAYTHATAGPWSRGNYGTLLVLGSANSDEHNRGYNDRYDCSSADINPIGSISKADINNVLHWASAAFKLPVLSETALATPLSETEPEAPDANDEADMGMTYQDLSILSRLRKAFKCGPVSMFQRLMESPPADWTGRDPAENARKVKLHFFYYGLHRHLMTTMPPSLHVTDNNPDDNRHDLRQFVYNCRWPRQFRAIDAVLARNGISATLPEDEVKDGSMMVPATMSGHFTYPRRSNVEIGHRWAALPDPNPLVSSDATSLEVMLAKAGADAGVIEEKLRAAGIQDGTTLRSIIRGEHHEYQDLRDALPGRSNASFRDRLLQCAEAWK